MMDSVRASKGDWLEARRMVSGPARAMSLASLGSTADRCAMAASGEYGSLRVWLGRGMKRIIR